MPKNNPAIPADAPTPRVRAPDLALRLAGTSASSLPGDLYRRALLMRLDQSTLPRADKETIKLCVNAHDELVAALRQIATYDPTQWDAATLGNIARAALAKVQA